MRIPVKTIEGQKYVSLSSLKKAVASKNQLFTIQVPHSSKPIVAGPYDELEEIKRELLKYEFSEFEPDLEEAKVAEENEDYEDAEAMSQYRIYSHSGSEIYRQKEPIATEDFVSHCLSEDMNSYFIFEFEEGETTYEEISKRFSDYHQGHEIVRLLWNKVKEMID